MIDRLRHRMQGNRTNEDGSLIIIVMMFTLVFLGMGIALYYLVNTNLGSAELERREVKAFNVAEAGIDAGMLALNQSWPSWAGESATVDETAVRTDFPADQYRDPSRSAPEDFINIAVYDNSVDGSGVPYSYDANRDNLLYIDSEANVDDDRHRILILAQRSTWHLMFPMIAMYADVAGANGTGLRVRVDPVQTEPLPEIDQTTGDLFVAAYYNGPYGKGVSLPADETVRANPSDPMLFDSWVTPSLQVALKGIAMQDGTYFTNSLDAQNLLTGTTVRTEAEGGDAAGKIVYVETTNGVIEVAANTQIGTADNPVVLLFDVPEGGTVGLDFKGTADFYGIIVSTGDLQVRGTCTFYGSVLAKGTLDSLGNGSVPEIHYNGNIIKTINQAHTISVNILPNSWEEYTLPKGAGS